jgi:hypothetical protein
VRAFDAFADLDRDGEHAFDTIEPRDQVARSGWVSASRFVPTCWLEVTLLLSMTRQAAGAVDFAGVEPKQMSTGVARMAAMLSGKMMSLVGAIELHEEPWIPPYLARQLSDGEI